MELQKGSLGGASYHAAFVNLFGQSPRAKYLFRELVVLLPVKDKQEALFTSK